MTLGKRLATELTGIAAWAVEGLTRLIANGGRFTLPESSIKATEELTESSSPIVLYVNERLSFDREDAQVQSRALWDSYRNWCAETNMRNYLNSYTFGRQLKQILAERGAYYVNRVDGKVRGYRGVELAACTLGVDASSKVVPISKAVTM